MAEKKFKVCMIGHSLAGWTAAALLQAKGHEVVVLESPDEPIEHDASEFLTGFMLKPLLKRVGYHPSQLTHIETLDVPFQWIDQERRLSWFTDDDRFRTELQREFPDLAAQMYRAFSHNPEAINIYRHLLNSRVHLPPEGYFSRKQFFKILKAVINLEHLEAMKTQAWFEEAQLGHELRELLSVCQVGLTSTESDYTTQAQMAHFLYALRWEGHTTEGGLRRIKLMLKEKFTSLGGTYFHYDKLSQLKWSGGHLQAITFDNDGQSHTVSFESVIVGGDPMGLILADASARPLNTWKKDLGKQCTRFGLRATKRVPIPSDVIPVGFRSQGMFFWNLGKPLSKEQRRFPRIVRFVLSAQDDAQSDLALSYFINPTGRLPESQTLDDEIDHILTEVFPFYTPSSGERIPWVIPDISGTVGQFSEPYIYHVGSHSGPWIDTTSVRTPIKNGFYAGKMILPELGLDGEILAGMHVSNEVAAY